MKKSLCLLLLIIAIQVATKCEAKSNKTEPSVAEIDSKIAQLLAKVNEGIANPNERSRIANETLVQYLKSVLSNPQLIAAALPKSKAARLTKLTSDDGKVCFYSWDTETGGTMHFFHDFVQWKAADGALWRDLNPPGKGDGDLATGYFYHDLHSVVTSDGKAVYMPTYRAIYSRGSSSDGITAYTLEGSKLVETPFFRTKTKLLKTIDVPSSDFEWNENGLIKFKNQNKTLLIPITVKGGGATGRFLTYRFNGKNFVFDESAHEKPE